MYLSETQLTSIIFDLTERIEDVGSDEVALEEHLADIIDEGDHRTGRVRRWGSPSTVLAEKLRVPSDSLLATIHHPQPQEQPQEQQQHQNKPQPVFTAIILTLIRLLSVKTDIVITINVPHVRGEYNEADIDLEAKNLGPQIREAVEIRDEILRTFEIKDWRLFDTDEVQYDGP